MIFCVMLQLSRVNVILYLLVCFSDILCYAPAQQSECDFIFACLFK